MTPNNEFIANVVGIIWMSAGFPLMCFFMDDLRQWIAMFIFLGGLYIFEYGIWGYRLMIVRTT